MIPESKTGLCLATLPEYSKCSEYPEYDESFVAPPLPPLTHFVETPRSLPLPRPKPVPAPAPPAKPLPRVPTQPEPPRPQPTPNRPNVISRTSALSRSFFRFLNPAGLILFLGTIEFQDGANLKKPLKPKVEPLESGPIPLTPANRSIDVATPLSVESLNVYETALKNLRLQQQLAHLTALIQMKKSEGLITVNEEARKSELEVRLYASASFDPTQRARLSRSDLRLALPSAESRDAALKKFRARFSILNINVCDEIQKQLLAEKSKTRMGDAIPVGVVTSELYLLKPKDIQAALIEDMRQALEFVFERFYNEQNRAPTLQEWFECLLKLDDEAHVVEPILVSKPDSETGVRLIVSGRETYQILLSLLTTDDFFNRQTLPESEYPVYTKDQIAHFIQEGLWYCLEVPNTSPPLQYLSSK